MMRVWRPNAARGLVVFRDLDVCSLPFFYFTLSVQWFSTTWPNVCVFYRCKICTISDFPITRPLEDSHLLLLLMKHPSCSCKFTAWCTTPCSTLHISCHYVTWQKYVPKAAGFGRIIGLPVLILTELLTQSHSDTAISIEQDLEHT